jgi:hypothetical protein
MRTVGRAVGAKRTGLYLNLHWSEYKLVLHCLKLIHCFLEPFFPEGGMGLVPNRGCLLTLAYYAFPRWYEFGERRRNDILTGENRITRRKTCPSATLSTTIPTLIEPGANPGLRGKRPATNDLSNSTAFFLEPLVHYTWILRFFPMALQPTLSIVLLCIELY